RKPLLVHNARPEGPKRRFLAGLKPSGISPGNGQAHGLTDGRRVVSLASRWPARRNHWPAAGIGCRGRKLIPCSAAWGPVAHASRREEHRHSDYRAIILFAVEVADGI